MHFPHHEAHPHTIDRWFTYDQFEYFFYWNPKTGEPLAHFRALSILTVAVFFGMLTSMGGINGVTHSFVTSGTIFLACYFFKFFTFARYYTDRRYLLWLLGVICVVSGGGSFFLMFTDVDEVRMNPAQQQYMRQKRRLLVQSSEWGAITLRFQFAIVFGWTTWYKLHADYLRGYILREHLIGLETFHQEQQQQQQHIFSQEQQTPENMFWIGVEGVLGSHVFQWMAIIGLLLDLGLFLAMTLRCPTVDHSRQFTMVASLIHGVMALTLGHTLGYSFSIVCFMGSFLFYPIGGGSNPVKRRQYSADTNLFGWLYRYATGNTVARANRLQRVFTVTWVIVQLALPARMLLVSNGNYPFPARGNRFSWTMSMHTKRTAIIHTGNYSFTDKTSSVSQAAEKLVPLSLFYLVPECEGEIIQRREYMPERAVAWEDPRTFPIDSILTEDHSSFIRDFPRFMARVAGGMSLVTHQLNPDVCGKDGRVSVIGVHFAKLNGHGAYCRIVDPTMNLAVAEMMRYHRPWWETLVAVALDRAPTHHEYILSTGIGSMNSKTDEHRKAIEKSVKGVRRIEFVADRASCLASRSLTLWPNNFPLAVIPLEMPSGTKLVVSTRVHSKSSTTDAASANTAGNQWDALDAPQTSSLELNKLHTVTAVSVEIGIALSGKSQLAACPDTMQEDVLLALIFIS